MFRVYHSNQLSKLKDLIAALMAQDTLPPFEQEVVLVQSPGMAQWLQIVLAQQLGVAANISFPLPATFIWDMFTRVLPGIPKESAFSKDAMMWKLLWLLPGKLAQPEFAPLQHYLADDGDKRKIHQLAARIADLFDQYLVYRPQWLERWQQHQLIEGLDSAQLWQASLWRALCDYTEELQQPGWHRANLYQKFIKKLDDQQPVANLPKRVFICGISALPPVYLQALNALGRHIDIHLMFTNPCCYYWGDIQGQAFLARLQSRRRLNWLDKQQTALFRHNSHATELFNDEGEQQLSNPLLASWGKLGRDHLYLLAALEGMQEGEFFDDPGQDNLLHAIQHDMLLLEDHSVIGMTQQSLNNSMEKRLLASTDRSVSVHVCHSAQREVEVLHDNLLEMMAADATLAPRDIIVMVADIDSYAPYIQAVFGNAPADRFMPFSISDRKASLSHPALDAFINLLSLPQSRFHAEDVLALLEVPALAARFNIDEEGLKLLRQWVAGAGVRWGLDDDTVRQLDLPPTGQHTWKFGLTRMLLGYAMDSRAGEWQAILPYDESCGLAAELAGNLAQFLMQLSQWRQCLAQPRTLEAWLPLCQEMLSAFFVAEGDAEVALALIEQQWQKVVGQGLAARYPDDVPIGVLHDELASRLDQERISQRFLAGSVNFCTLMPMRSIPFRVVCLLGMNDGVYPRTLAPLGFDLMAKNIQRGDRSRRDDDRYLFLEALLSAEECLYLSYVGYAIQDNSQRLPSVLVSELLDYIGQNFCLQQHLHSPADESARAVKGHVSVLHTRTPFDVANFIPDSEQQSYATEWLPAATMSGQAALDFSQPLAAAQISEVTLEQLVRFYRHPVKGFFQMRLGVSFVLEQTDLPDEEPFVLDNLSRYQFNYQLLNCLVAGEDSQALYQRLKASGGLPYGVFGELYWQKQQAEIQMLAQQVRETRQESDSLEIDLLCDGLRLTGWLHHVQADGLLRWRPAQLQARDGMLLWLEHLVYCACGGGGSSRMLGTNDSQWHFAAIDSSCALQQLTQLIKGYRQGLRAPLLLLYKSGWAWLNECYDHTTNRLSDDVTCQEKARNKLLQAWQGNAFSPGESSDPYLQRVMRSLSDDQLDEICRQAMSFLVPLLKNNHE